MGRSRRFPGRSRGSSDRSRRHLTRPSASVDGPIRLLVPGPVDLIDLTPAGPGLLAVQVVEIPLADPRAPLPGCSARFLVTSIDRDAEAVLARRGGATSQSAVRSRSGIRASWIISDVPLSVSVPRTPPLGHSRIDWLITNRIRDGGNRIRSMLNRGGRGGPVEVRVSRSSIATRKQARRLFDIV